MKTILNTVTTIAKTENVLATYGDLLTSILNRPISKTLDLKAMRRDFRLLDLFEVGGESFQLSTEDFGYIASLVENSEWVFKHKDILGFADYIDSLKA